MEVVAKNGTKKVNVGVILSDLMKRANEHDKVDFFDIHGTPFNNDNFPEDQDFIERGNSTECEKHEDYHGFLYG